MSEWSKVTMHEAGYLQNGSVPYFSGVTNYLATADVVGFKKQPSEEVTFCSRPSRAQIYLAVGDVLQAKMRDTNKSFVVDAETQGWIASTGFARFKPNRVNNLPLYIYYIVTSKPFLRERDRLCVGTTQQAISDRDLRNIHVTLPKCLQEQRKIAHILQFIDRAIEKTEALIHKYQQIKTGLMHDLFTRGIGANNQLRPSYEQAPELYQKTPIGWFPREWSMHILQSLYAEPHKNGLYKPSSYHGSGLIMVNMGDIFNSVYVQFKDTTRVELTDEEKVVYGLRSGDLLFGRRSLVMEGAGKCALVSDLNEEATFESSIIRVRLNRNLISPYFAAFFLESKIAYKDRRRFIRQVAVSGISGSDLKQFRIPLPELEEQELIVNQINAIDDKLSTDIQKKNKLKKQKTGLMHDLLTGKVSVPLEPEEEPEVVHV